jgi:hypothetical protein
MAAGPSSRAHDHDVVLSKLLVTGQTKHTTTSASPCCTHRTHPRPLLATVSHGHRCHVRRRWGSAWPGGQGPPLVEPWQLRDAPGPVDAPHHFSSIVIDHRAGNRPFPMPLLRSLLRPPRTRPSYHRPCLVEPTLPMHAYGPPATPPPPFVARVPPRRSAEPTSPPSSASGA